MSNENDETIYRKPNFWRKGNRISSVEDTVRVFIGGQKPGDAGSKPKKLPLQQNRIVSTKYTLLTFLPQNMFEQFRRIANFYFLLMTIIAMAIDSPVSYLTSLIPLVFVICVTAAKQGYEDFLRYRADNMVNKSLVTVIRNSVEVEIRCEDIIPGDLVRVSRDCDVPCDLILLKSSDDGKCFITTANLDGETNLKMLVVPKGLPDTDVPKLHTLGVIECEQPHIDLYSFNGRIELPQTINRVSVIPTDIELQTGLQNIPLMAENLMLRGSRVKNTEWAIACAVYCGQNTKLALNSKITKNKMSSSEQFINKYLAFFIILLLAVVTISYFMKRYYDLYHPEHNYYLQQIIDEYVVSGFLQDYFSFLILFNYLIPISLYVTIEMHKFVGAFFLEWDPHLYDEETNQPCIVNTSDLNEELGQINILFSDKTGTLTKNIMIFKKCSINGKMYLQEGRGLQEVNRNYSLKIGECSKSVYTFFEALAVCHTVQVAGKYEEDEDRAEEETNLLSHNGEIPPIFHKSLEELNDIESVHEEIDFITTKQTITFEQRIEHSKPEDARPSSDANPLTKNRRESAHKRPLSLSNIQIPKGSTQGPLSPVKHLDFVKDNMLLRKVQQQEYKRAHSHNAPVTDSVMIQTTTMTHRRTQSSVPFGYSEVSDVVTRPPAFQRLSSVRTSTREYYAAPQYTEAQVVERQESMVHRKELETFIDILDYHASSPDEKALVEACARLGVIYLNDNNDIYTLRLRMKRKPDTELMGMEESTDGENNDIVQFKRLQVLEFTSDRKRMSVIVMDKFGQIWLYTKGAESHVLPLCNTKSAHVSIVTQKHINDFAKEGLRTLAVARRKLTKTEFINFINELNEANTSLSNRVEKVEACQRKIESGLDLLGATAVEDALQDDVHDTLVSIRAAGIKVWVLTGDKVETALNIALSCGHIPEDAEKYFIVECKNEAQLNGHLEALARELERKPENEYALLIDGQSLAIALQHSAVKFRDLAYNCHAVLCCRLSPLQKCEVVHLVKTSPFKPITAAIGDGANDVSMIQEAHVGLGIVGKEGRQAARCADYSFAKFSMLKRIVLLHGHYFSHRLALLVLYFFYKNVVFMGCQLFFQADSLFSTASIYDSLFLTLFNVSYTTLPILFISITEKIHDENELMNKPSLYQQVAGNKLFGWRYFNGWMFIGFFHSIIIYYFAWYIWKENSAVYSEGRTVNFLCFGMFMVHNVVVLVNLKLLIEAIYKSYIFVATIWLSIFGFMGTTFIYNLFNAGYDMNLFMVYSMLLSSKFFWALSTLIVVTGLLPDLFFKAVEALNFRLRTIFPGNEAMGTTKHGPKLIQTTYL